ncbi:MAG: Multifunctional non-homologous end joining protein LigD [Nitrospirae bacterium]|nr:Multifunctional non-homologous end joining protein LigD [Nitrospirota bacterium]MCE7965356.1 DNA ligase D [Nitrospira sp. NTP2]MCK6493424.1 DNA ligase D [Nitrospira sp.]MEB2338930.1 DNA ligase D [Nitrospirales bacterium]QOJ34358.1 MAG: DNA ligase D [Nitrospira sp.]
MSLKPYWRKRNFNNTPEPRGRPGSGEGAGLYVIQQHAASRLHYDFRLELDGTLKSWAIPKGPSLDPTQKRLAVHVEDHPLDYAQFEGLIPAGQYGGGTVLLWDWGHWVPLEDAREGLRRGRLKFTLQGDKLSGVWTLVRMGGKQEAGKENWLLIKERDEAARKGAEAEVTRILTKSVASGRTLEEIAAGRRNVWQAGRSSRKSVRARPARLSGTTPPKDARKARQESRMAPQLATLVDRVPEGDAWIHELKYDGYRILCRIRDGKATLWTRNGIEWTAKLRPMAETLAALPVESAWLDGEVVALLPDGRVSFQALQNAFESGGAANLAYYLFDLLYLDGYDLRPAALVERKRCLAALLEGEDGAGLIRYSDHIPGRGDKVFAEACRLGLEGVMAKRADAPYLEGRSHAWVKVKCQQRQEFVIGGFTEPSGMRAGFGALLLGWYDDRGQLRYAGRTGTGFSARSLQELHRRLRAIQRRSSPFKAVPATADRAKIHWVEPSLVAEVAFAEWTKDGQLRQASFQGLRDDKPASTVRREQVPANQASKYPSATKSGRKARGLETDSSENLVIEGVTLSHPQRMLYPEQQLTKEALARYYETVSEWILPHLQGRPLSLVRCPEGYEQECFYQKHATDRIPDVIGRVEIPTKESSASYMVADSLPALIGLVQLGVLELHTWGARRDRLERPDRFVLDLDPAPDVPWPMVVEAAQLLRTLLQELDLRSFVKTTGGKGLHVVVPIRRTQGWDEVKAFSKAVAEHLVGTIPERFIATMSKQKRGGKIFIDYLRNAEGATAVAAYSTRARRGAPVSVPLAWDELSPGLRSDHFTVVDLPQRLRQLAEDPWREYFSQRQTITRSMLAKLRR